MSKLAELLFGVCMLLPCGVAITSILYFFRGTHGPVYWASCCWLLLVGLLRFLVAPLSITC